MKAKSRGGRRRAAMGALIVPHVVGIILWSGLTGCSQPGYVYEAPGQMDDGWTTAALSDVGIDSAELTGMMDALARLDDNPLHSILIVKGGMLVFEEYFPGDDFSIEGGGLHFVEKDFGPYDVHGLASASKSVTSVLLGIAIDRGLVQGVDDRLFAHFPEYADLSDAVKDTITLRHLLTMSSGIPWDESAAYTDAGNDLFRMFRQCDDPIAYVLEKELVAPPGDAFIYNSGTTILLGEVVSRASGMPLVEFAGQHLFAPLGVIDYEWTCLPNAPGMAAASSLLYLRPRDMARIGQLYLQNGRWNGTRVVSEEWVHESTSEAIAVPREKDPAPELRTSYGYQWWRGTFPTGDTDTFYAAGWGGQFIFVLPELDTVIVFTAGKYDRGYSGFYTMVNDYLLPAIGAAG